MKNLSFIGFLQLCSRIILKSGGFAASIGFAAMVVLVTSGAVLRYGFGWSPGWIDSVCAYLVLFIVVMSAGDTLAKDKHIRILFFYDRLPVNTRVWLDLLCGLISLALIGFLISTTTDLATMSRELESTTPDGLLLFPMQILIPVGLSVLFIGMVGFTLRAVRRLLAGERATPT
ncbi:MAG: TRAP transporter small permease [bacterium]